MVECIFRENEAESDDGGGGLATTGTGSVVTILRSVFANNSASDGVGGGISGSRGFITIEASTISGNVTVGAVRRGFRLRQAVSRRSRRLFDVQSRPRTARKGVGDRAGVRVPVRDHARTS